MIYRVIKDRTDLSESCLSLKVFDQVQLIEESDSKGDWPNWILCEHQETRGWVPEQIIHKISPDKGLISQDYEGHELKVVTGDQVEGYDLLNGWLYASTSDGKSWGWVPLNHLEALDGCEIRFLGDCDIEDLIGFEQGIRISEPDIWVGDFKAQTYRDFIKAKGLSRKSNRILGLYKEEQMIGRCDMIVYDNLMDVDKTLYIDWIYVDINYRGKGHAQDLLRAVYRYAHSIGAEYVYLFTASNDQAQVFYEKQATLELTDRQVAGKYITYED